MEAPFSQQQLAYLAENFGPPSRSRARSRSPIGDRRSNSLPPPGTGLRTTASEPGEHIDGSLAWYPATHQLVTTLSVHVVAHCYYSLLSLTDIAHSYYSLLSLTAISHCYYSLLLLTATIHCYYTLLAHITHYYCSQCPPPFTGSTGYCGALSLHINVAHITHCCCSLLWLTASIHCYIWWLLPLLYHCHILEYVLSLFVSSGVTCIISVAILFPRYITDCYCLYYGLFRAH